MGEDANTADCASDGTQHIGMLSDAHCERDAKRERQRETKSVYRTWAQYTQKTEGRQWHGNVDLDNSTAMPYTGPHAQIPPHTAPSCTHTRFTCVYLAWNMLSRKNWFPLVETLFQTILSTFGPNLDSKDVNRKSLSHLAIFYGRSIGWAHTAAQLDAPSTRYCSHTMGIGSS